MKLAVIVQARSNSKRLKNKMLQHLVDRSVIEWVLIRLKKSKKIKNFVLATTTNKSDLPLIKIAKKYNFKIFRGNENDVLRRFYDCSKKLNLKTIVRVCADNPLIDSKEIDRLVMNFKKKNLDYLYNNMQTKENLNADGFGAEIFNFASLEKAHKLSKKLSDREHVTKFMYRKQSLFRTRNFGLKISLRRYKFAIDTKKDFLIAKKIYDKLKKAKKQYTYKLKDLVNCYKQIA